MEDMKRRTWRDRNARAFVARLRARKLILSSLLSLSLSSRPSKSRNLAPSRNVNLWCQIVLADSTNLHVNQTVTFSALVNYPTTRFCCCNDVVVVVRGLIREKREMHAGWDSAISVKVTDTYRYNFPILQTTVHSFGKLLFHYNATNKWVLNDGRRDKNELFVLPFVTHRITSNTWLFTRDEIHIAK